MPHPGIKVATSPTFDGRLKGEIPYFIITGLGINSIYYRNWWGVQRQSQDFCANDTGAWKFSAQEN